VGAEVGAEIETPVETIDRDATRDRFADFEREVLQDNIALCDTKAGLLLAFSGAMVIFCIDAFARAHAAANGGAPIGIVIQAAIGLAAAGFLASAQFSLTTVLPRMIRGGSDHIFWESPVFKLPLERYLAEMEGVSPAIERRDMLRHLHLQAQICRSKFRHFLIAMRLAQIAFAALVLGEVLRVAG